MFKTVCIFCASSTKVPQAYHQAADELSVLLIKNRFSVQYGGGSVGLMGTIARNYNKMNGHIVGVIPKFMVDMEWANHDISELIVVKDMQERKKRMIRDVDAVIALAGGIGTLDELVEVITLKQLGQFTKPVIILNTQNFYDPVISQFEKMVTEGFMRKAHQRLWHIVKTPAAVMEAIDTLKDSDYSVIKSAQL